MNALNSIFGWILGWPMWLIYKIVGDYGLSLILFTLIIQVAMLPLTIKQKKSMAKNTALMPQQEMLRKKYANNPQKLQEEQQKLFDESGYSMASGCLVPLIQFPILFGLTDVVYRPLTHIARIPKEIIDKALEIANSIGTNIDVKNLQREIMLISNIKSNPSAYSAIDSSSLDKILNLDLTIFGLDSTIIPKFGLTLIAMIPILSALVSVLQTLYNNYITRQSAPEGAPSMGGNTILMMMVLGPVMSLMIGYRFPIGVTISWTMRSIINFLQEVILNRFMPQWKLVEQAGVEMAEHRKKYLGKQKVERKVQVVNDKGETVEKKVSQREYEKRKLAEARLRDAEKYGYKLDSENNEG